MSDQAKIIERKIRTTNLRRIAYFDRKTLDMDKRTVELAFSSESGVDRWFGTEILDHGKKSVRLDRLKNTGPLLLHHDSREHVGTIESAKIDDKDRVGRAVVRLGRGPERDAVLQDIEDGIRKCVSVGYRIHRMKLEEQGDNEADIYRATDWEPYEVSLVSMPADTSVGVGREAREWHNGDSETHDTIILEIAKKEQTVMSDKDKEPEVTRKPAPADVRVEPKQVDADAIRKAELTRIRVIGAAGEKYGQRELAEKCIDDGDTLDAFNRKLLDALPGAKDPAKLDSPEARDDKDIGMSKRQKNDFSFVRLIRAQALGSKQPQFVEDAAFELECCREAEKDYEGKRLGGFVIPTDVLSHTREDLSRDRRVISELTRLLQQRVLTEGVAGASTIAEDLLSGSFIDLLRNSMVLTALGVTRMSGLVGDVAIPRQSGSGTAFWLATDETDITEATPTLDQVTMVPRNVGAMEIYTRQLLMQSSVAIEALIRSDIATTLAIEIDRAGLYGSGAAGQPTGIANTAGIGAPGPFAGPVPTYAEVVAFESNVAASNALAGNLAYLIEPPMRGSLKTTEKATGTAQFVFEPGNTLNGYRTEVSNQVVSGDVFFANWSDLLQGEWGGLEVLADPYTLGARFNVRIIAIWTTDFALRHPESFALDNDTP